MISRDGNKGGPLYFIEDSKTKKIPKNEITINLKQDFKANSHDIIGRWVLINCENSEKHNSQEFSINTVCFTRHGSSGHFGPDLILSPRLLFIINIFRIIRPF